MTTVFYFATTCVEPTCKGWRPDGLCGLWPSAQVRNKLNGMLSDRNQSAALFKKIYSVTENCNYLKKMSE